MCIAINHILIRVADLKGMVLFFEQALELNNGYRPEFPFPGAWLWGDDRPLIHLSENNPADSSQAEYLNSQQAISKSGTGSIDHIAFSGCDYAKLIQRLNLYQLEYFERTLPLSAERQVFISGPEGLRIEIQFDSNTLESAGV